MTEALSRLAGQRRSLEESNSALLARLQRCDDAIAAEAEDQRVYDQLQAQHDRTVADCIAYGRRVPEMDPALNLQEIKLRRSKSVARGARQAKEGIQAELAAINARLAQVVSAYEEAVWGAVPGAACGFFQQAEGARRSYEAQLAAIDGVIAYASQQGGGNPQHPAFRCAVTIREMGDKLMSELGAGATRDFRSGPALIESLEAGTAQMGDVSRWLPRAQPNGSDNFNRGEAAAEPVQGPSLPNPAIPRPDTDLAIQGSPEAVLPAYLEAAYRARVG